MRRVTTAVTTLIQMKRRVVAPTAAILVQRMRAVLVMKGRRPLFLH